MIDNLLFVGDVIPAEAEKTYGTRNENQPEVKVSVYENVSEDHKNKYITPCFDAEGKPQYSDPDLKVDRIGEVVLNLPPNTPKDTPIRVVFRTSTVGLEVTAENLKTGESVNGEIILDNGKTEQQVAEDKERMSKVRPMAEI